MENFQRSLLLANAKKSIELWFLAGGQHITKADDAKKWSYEASAFEEILATNVEILLHGLRFGGHLQESKNQPFATANVENELDTLKKLIEDFEWVRRTAQIRVAFNDRINASPSQSIATTAASPSLSAAATATTAATITKTTTVKQFFCSWIMRNLKSNCLCACLQAFIADKELLELYYEETSFLRTEKYSTALFICLSALELNQYSLLSQIDVDLLHSTTKTGGVNAMHKSAKHKRSSSHPNFSLSPPKRETRTGSPKIQSQMSEGSSSQNMYSLQKQINTSPLPQPPVVPISIVFPTFRKTKSLPDIPNIIEEASSPKTALKSRPRSMTMNVNPKIAQSAPKIIPQPLRAFKQRKNRINTILLSPSNTSSSYSDEDLQPSTSASSRNSQASNATLHSNSTLNSNSMSNSSANSKTTACRIELIKCDDIRIWTDQSHELRNQLQKPELKQTTESCDIPKKSSLTKQTKSISPINNFLSSLFSTPPIYTSWALKPNAFASDDQSGSSEPVLDSSSSSVAFPCNEDRDIDYAKSGSVFDAFLPIYGKKLRSRKSQNLFEDGISTLDYSVPNVRLRSDPIDASTASTAHEHPQSSLTDCESLTSFLQMAHLSRNNTELEKENAHFRISEAIISAIEHMKWAKLEPDRWRRHSETAIAANWLENDHQRNNSERKETIESGEHIPYAELGESCLDLPSAEVVGLTLISKFNDKHLPKVSKLKWLVSDEDTPQKLLPMPDNSPIVNPDVAIMPPMTRGTRYWAPPRPQIIFTDHPQSNRKQQIRKQNNRCAGCGMRVSPQHLHSFRYCTYLGKYHCTGCHRNQISAIPAKMLHQWDFKCYPVSVFAYRLLEQMYTYPLFYVPDLNPALYVNNKALLVARTKRVQLKFAKDFIRMCRFATREQHYFDCIPDHITGDPDMWSMSDFVDAYNKSMKRSIDELITHCENHIFNCVLCTARGFFCEYCRKDEVIYPWESKTFRCDRCGSCFHMNCWRQMSDTCYRCQRMDKRQVQIDDEF